MPECFPSRACRVSGGRACGDGLQASSLRQGEGQQINPQAQAGADYSSEARALLWKRRWQQAREYYRPLDEKYEKELEFALKLKHWDSDAGGSPPTSKTDKFKGRELYSKIRREVAEVMAAPRSVSCAPVDTEMDPKTADAAKFPVEHVVKTPQYGFDVYLERVVWSSVAARRGVLWAEWDARINDIVFSVDDPRRNFLTPGWLDPWDRTLPWMIRQVPMRLVDVQARWPDLELIADLKGSDLDYDLARYDTTNRSAAEREPQADPNREGKVLVLICWSQFDEETRPEVVGQRPVEPYSYCPHCGHKNVSDVAGLACPECMRGPGVANEMQLALSENYVEDVPVLPGGRALEYVFPLQQKAVRGPWPTGQNGEQLRSVPCMLLRRTEHPIEFCGLSDTAIDAPMQTLSNQLMERMRRQVQGPSTVAGVFGQPEDSDGNPWQPTDDPFQMVYFPDPAFDVKTIQLADVSPALFNAIQYVQEQFRADLGTFELSASGAEDVKGVAVGTVEQAAQSGSVPIAHFIKRVQFALGNFYGVISDWLRIGWTAQRWVRYQGLLGMAKYQLVSGADIPNADFIFTEGTENQRADKAEIDALLAWYQTGLPPMGSPAIRRALAAAGKFPISMDLVDQIEQAEAEALEAQEEAMLAGGGPMAPDAAGMGGAGQDPNGPEAGAPADMEGAPDMPAALMGARGMA